MNSLVVIAVKLTVLVLYFNIILNLLIIVFKEIVSPRTLFKLIILVADSVRMKLPLIPL